MPNISQQDYIRLEIQGLNYDEWGAIASDLYANRLRECYKNSTLLDVVFFCNREYDGTPATSPWEARVTNYIVQEDGIHLWVRCGDTVEEIAFPLTD